MTLKKTKKAASESTEHWDLRLYVAGQTVRAVAAFANLQKICEEHLPGQYRIEVIDLLKRPQLAKGDQILAVPTLVRKLPEPVRKIIGDLSDTERVLVGLDLRPRDTQRIKASEINRGEVHDSGCKTKESSKDQKPAAWDLRLYVADKSPQSILAFQNLKNACEDHLSGRYRIEVIDVIMHPEAARADQIVALPTLVRRSPKPVRAGIGDLTNTGLLLDLLNRN